jgi:hypothetical protein
VFFSKWVILCISNLNTSNIVWWGKCSLAVGPSHHLWEFNSETKKLLFFKNSSTFGGNHTCGYCILFVHTVASFIRKNCRFLSPAPTCAPIKAPYINRQLCAKWGAHIWEVTMCWLNIFSSFLVSLKQVQSLFRAIWRRWKNMSGTKL